MGLGMGIGQLLIILLIVALIFGTKRLKSIGGDLGGALKGFRTAMDSDEDKQRKDEERRRLESNEADAEFAEQKDKSGRA